MLDLHQRGFWPTLWLAAALLVLSLSPTIFKDYFAVTQTYYLMGGIFGIAFALGLIFRWKQIRVVVIALLLLSLPGLSMVTIERIQSEEHAVVWILYSLATVGIVVLLFAVPSIKDYLQHRDRVAQNNAV